MVFKIFGRPVVTKVSTCGRSSFFDLKFEITRKNYVEKGKICEIYPKLTIFLKNCSLAPSGGKSNYTLKQ